jgi:hypothetical protein
MTPRISIELYPRLAVATLMAAVLAVPRPEVGAAQQPVPNQVRMGSGGLFGDSPAENELFREQRLRALNIQRQKDLVSDTQKLLLLTAQFHEEIGKQSATQLTPAQLREVTQIEKLARSVREKMTDNEGEPGPVFRTPFETSTP